MLAQTCLVTHQANNNMAYTVVPSFCLSLKSNPC